MLLLKLFWAFFKVGLFTFGGAYGAIPLIREAAVGAGWLTADEFSYLLGISESTPGPIMVNSATYIGSRTSGFFGSVCCTVGVVLAAFVIMLIISKYFMKQMERPGVKSVLNAIKPCVIGIIISTGITMFVAAIGFNVKIEKFAVSQFDWRAAVIAVVLITIMAVYKIIRKKNFSPILLICISAVLGIVLYY